MASSRRPGTGPRIALVLGSGGIVGGAYHAGALKALHDTWDIDPRAVELIVGTSAGAVTGSLLAAGLHPDDLFRRETGRPLSPAGTTIVRRGRAKRGPRPKLMSAIGAPAAPQAVLRAMARPDRVSAGGVMAALLPRGAVPTDHLASTVQAILGPNWPTGPRLRFAAVELATARRVALTAEDDVDDLDDVTRLVGADPGTAVAASCAVPSVFEPVTIHDRAYVDGGVHSADNLDLIGTSPFDLVIVSSASGSARPLSGGLPLAGLREMARLQTDRERRGLRQACRVEVLRPATRDLDAMGSDMFDASRRSAVAHQAHASVSAHLGRLPVP